MNQIQKISKFIFVIILLLSFIFAGSQVVNATDNAYREEISIQAGDVVYFEKPDSWSDSVPNIYAWKYDGSSTYKNADFPGVSMTLVNNNLYKYEFTSDAVFNKFIFSDGSNKDVKTENLNFICSGFVYDENTSTDNLDFNIISLKAGDTINFERPSSWNSEDSVHVYMWDSYNTSSKISEWADRPAMTLVDGNSYTYTLPETTPSNGFNLIIFTDGKADGAKQTKDLSTIGTNLTFIANNEPTDGNYDGFWASTDKSDLSKLVKNTTIPVADKDFYTIDSYNYYKKQYDLASSLLNYKFIASTYLYYTSQYYKSLLGLKCTYDNLVLNTSILSNKIDEMNAVDTSKYEPTLVQAFTESIAEATSILRNSDTLTLNSMKNALNNMEIAYNNLTVDKSELEALINKAKSIDTNLYTYESSNTLLNTLDDATITFEDVNASYSEVQNQIKKLTEAIDNLVLKDNEAPAETTENNEDADTTQKESNTTDSSNPHTGDIIFALIELALLSIIIFTVSNKYLKNHKNN